MEERTMTCPNCEPAGSGKARPFYKGAAPTKCRCCKGTGTATVYVAKRQVTVEVVTDRRYMTEQTIKSLSGSKIRQAKLGCGITIK